MTEVERALSDLAEVRDRLANVQRFEGYSAPAAAASGVAALAAGVVQYELVPHPTTAPQLQLYLTIWLACLALALVLNYGAVALWLVHQRGPGAQSRFRSAALSIAPSVLLGGTITAALVNHSMIAMLPGTWFAFYALGLFASHGAVPRETIVVTFAFAILALVFLLTPVGGNALAWWVMPAGFGVGQLAIGYLLWRYRTA